ncbi:MAG TPA: hypothetical protein VEA44_12020 [Caulobacter sp.]|nr:hypothetical protein [Caulobacter sp.]
MGLVAQGVEFEPVFTPEALAAVRAHPGFRAAVTGLARTSVELYSGHRLLNLVASDRGRFVTAMLVGRLHHEGRLTAASLKSLCARHGFASPGRTSALIALMRWAGYLTVQGRTLIPTPRFFATQGQRVAGELAAVGQVSPAARTVSERLPDPALLGRFLTALTQLYESGERLVDNAPVLEFCIERIGGFLVLNDLMLRARETDDILPISVSAWSRRFCISRPHVLMVLREAEAAGLIARTEAGVEVRPALLEALDAFFAGVIHVNARAAEEALGPAAV